MTTPQGVTFRWPSLVQLFPDYQILKVKLVCLGWWLVTIPITDMNQMFRVYKKKKKRKKSIMRNEIPVLKLIIVAPRSKATCIPFKQLIKQFCIWHMLMTVMINRYNMYKLSDLTYVRSLNWCRTRLVSSNFVVHCHLNVTPYRVEVQSLLAINEKMGSN